MLPGPSCCYRQFPACMQEVYATNKAEQVSWHPKCRTAWTLVFLAGLPVDTDASHLTDTCMPSTSADDAVSCCQHSSHVTSLTGLLHPTPPSPPPPRIESPALPVMKASLHAFSKPCVNMSYFHAIRMLKAVPRALASMETPAKGSLGVPDTGCNPSWAKCSSH